MSSIESKPRIIVIDDNPAIHEDFRKILCPNENKRDLADAAAAFFGEEASVSDSTLPFEIELDCADQGQTGFEMVKAALSDRPYTMAFCDMRMPPGWDGLTTIEKLWEADPNLQVVISSAYSDNTWTDISQRLGRTDRLLILKKPFDNAEVLQMAAAMIEKRRLQDVTHAKQEELEHLVGERTQHLLEARLESEQFLSAIGSLMVGTDSQGVVRRWNESAAEAFAITEPEAIGKRFEELPIQWESESFPAELVQRDQDDSKRREGTFIDPCGAVRIVGLSSYPVVDDGEFKGMLIMGTELTQHRILEQQLHNAQKLESVGQLAAGVAHEINTPMQYLGDNLDYLNTKFDKLIGYLESCIELTETAEKEGIALELVETLQTKAKKLKLTKLFKQIPEAFTDSIEGVGHVSRIVRAMKELSHPGGEEKTAVNVNKSLETTLTVSTNEWKYVADAEMDLDPNIEEVPACAGELNQVFLNLIVNAAHAISDVTDNGNEGKGKLMIRTRQHDGFVRVEIGDTGGGIPMDIRGRIFDPFFTTKEVGKGTGQGLAIAHSVVVQKQGGNLSFDVEEGVGTTFIIDLPNTEQDIPAEDSQQDTADTVAASGQTTTA